MRKFLFCLSVLMLIMTIAACGGRGQGGGQLQSKNATVGAGAHQTEKISMRIAWWGGQQRHDYTLKVIELYESLHPHVKIEPQYVGWEDYWRKLAPEAAANQLPDIMQMDLSYITQYGMRNQLADLTPYLGTIIDVEDIPSSALFGGRIGERLYGFNIGVNALQLHIDPVLLKEVTGLDHLPTDWTWQDYEELAMKAAEQGYYFDTGLRPEVFFGYYLRTHGKTLYSQDGFQLGYEDDQLFIDFFGMTTRIALAGGSPLPNVSAQIKGLEEDLLVRGQAIVVWQWSNQFIGLQQVASRPLQIHPLPGPNQSEGLYLKPSMFWSISESSKHKEEAAKFIDFFINHPEANELMLGERGVPVSIAVQDALKPLLSEEQVKVYDYISWVGENSSPMDPPDPLGAAEVMDLFKTLDEAMKFEQITVGEAAKRFREEANQILARSK